MGLIKIDSILFRVKNLEKSTKFYEKGLGMRKAWADKKMYMVGLAFHNNDSEIVIHNNPDIPNPSFSFLVKNVESFCKEFKKKNGKILKEPFDVRTGKFAVLSDPDGNEIPIIDLTKFGGKPRYD